MSDPYKDNYDKSLEIVENQLDEDIGRKRREGFTRMNYRASGDADSNYDTVVDYLRTNYTLPDGNPINSKKARILTTIHGDLVDKAMNFGSHAYYPGDEIADKEGLLWISYPEEIERKFSDGWPGTVNE